MELKTIYNILGFLSWVGIGVIICFIIGYFKFKYQKKVLKTKKI